MSEPIGDEPIDVGDVWGNEAHLAAMYDRFITHPSDTVSFVLERQHIEPDTTFSAEAMEWLRNALFVYTGARIMHAWAKRNEPPTRVRVTVTVEAA